MNYTAKHQELIPMVLAWPRISLLQTQSCGFSCEFQYIKNHNLTIGDMDVVSSKSGFMSLMPFSILIIFGLEQDIVQHHVLSSVIFLTRHDVTKWLKISKQALTQRWTFCTLHSSKYLHLIHNGMSFNAVDNSPKSTAR